MCKPEDGDGGTNCKVGGDHHTRVDQDKRLWRHLRVRREQVRVGSPTTLELRCVNSRIIPVTAFVTQAVAATLSLVPSLRIAWI